VKLGLALKADASCEVAGFQPYAFETGKAKYPAHVGVEEQATNG